MRWLTHRSPARLAVALLTLLTFGTGLVNLCLPDDDDAGGPAFYDGDGDDVGVVQERARSPVASDAALLQAPGVLPTRLVSNPGMVPPDRDALPVAHPGDLTSRAPPA